MPSTAANPEPSPAALADDERHDRERQEALNAYNARRAELGKPPLALDILARKLAVDEEVRQRAGAMRRHDEKKQAQQAAEEQRAGRSFSEMIEHARQRQRARQEREANSEPEPQQPAAAPKSQPKQEKNSKILNLPLIPATTRAVVNEIASSALFAAIQGKDRKLVKALPVAATGETKMLFSGEQLNQDDHDVFMLLISIASGKPLGEYITVSAHSLLKQLGRKTGGTQHKQLDEEIKRLTEATVEIRHKRYVYIGHLIHDALKHEASDQWIYALNEKLVSMYGASCYTLIDWEQRKRLKGKDLARWLQLEIARHAVPFPIKVETLREKCGSQAKDLWKFRQTLKTALETLKAEGHITAWRIDENDLVHVDRGAAITASQRRRLALPKPRNRKP